MRLKRNAEPTPDDLRSLARDAVMAGRINDAVTICSEAGMNYADTGALVLGAISTVMADQGAKAARPLFRRARDLWPGAELPVRLRALVPFNAKQVTRDMAWELENNGTTEYLRVEPSELGGFGVKGFEVIWRSGHHSEREYQVVKNQDAAEELAIARVKQDLEYEPEIFNQDFLMRHIDADKLREVVFEMAKDPDYIQELSTKDFWRAAQQYGVDVPDEDEDGDLRDPTAAEQDELETAMASERADRPWDYLEEIFDAAEARAFVMREVGIDIDAAAKDAVDTDGAGQFLGTYDGELEISISGFAFWRIN